ncbi:MAG: DUF1667 domain-containing protein [Candidatus Omnitrophota bacterium]|nr:DUF1667 domain-containing protein [Candidatus Omnitrophota bacterium]MBU1894924.1 DUF1667 domain-containing protein [Candidatus Omnitrophota bacterium]
MIKKITCIECPKGCGLSVNIENGKVVTVEGNACLKGIKYAAAEIENPVRILTSTVLTKGMSLKMVPVRTDRPIQKSYIRQAMKKIEKICLTKTLKTGDVIDENFLNLGVKLIVTRGVSRI